MTHRRRQFLQLAVGAATLPLLTRAATAQDSYPSRPIRLIVGFTPGTAADITARAFGNGASDLLGQQIVVEDKPGAGSSIAAEYVARAAKDGYTLFLSSLSIVTSQTSIRIRHLIWKKTSHRSRSSPAALSSWLSVLNQT